MPASIFAGIVERSRKAVSPRRRVFREWLNRGGVMKLHGGWRYDAAAKQLQIAIDQMQMQTQGLYRMPIEIGFTVPSNSGAPVMRTAKIAVEQQHNVLNVALDTVPSDVQLDPNLWGR